MLMELPHSMHSKTCSVIWYVQPHLVILLPCYKCIYYLHECIYMNGFSKLTLFLKKCDFVICFQPLKVTTPRGSDYLLQYDDAGALQSLTTPRGHIHAFSLQTSLGFFKYQYFSPMNRHPFELRYNDDGQILAKLYPHQSGRVAYVYDQSGKLDTVLAGTYNEFTDRE